MSLANADGKLTAVSAVVAVKRKQSLRVNDGGRRVSRGGVLVETQLRVVCGENVDWRWIFEAVYAIV